MKCQLYQIPWVQIGGVMLEFIVRFYGSTPKYVQLYDYIKSEIINGNIKSGSKLPSSRMLATHLSVSRNTIISAYDLLSSEGYMESKSKRGYFISNDIDMDYITRPIKHNKRYNAELPSEIKKNYKVDFKYGQIDSKNFPYTQWRRALTCGFNSENIDSLSYGDKQGELSLRTIIADYIHKARGVICSPDQIVLTSGTQMSLDYICRLINHQYQSIAVEEPGYVVARTIFELNKFKVQPIELNDDGMDINDLQEKKSRVALVAPSHQFPFGMTMPVSKRIELLKWAEEKGGIIIENDYEGEFSHSGKPITCLQSFDNRGCVIYLYTFSGSLLPAARMSLFVLPRPLLEDYKQLLGSLEQTVPVYQQKALESFIAEGEWEKHIRRMKKLYKAKFIVLKEAINESMGKCVKIIGNEIGLHVLLNINNGMDEKTLIEKAEDVGVKVYSTSKFWFDGQNQKSELILLGYGNISKEEIVEGIKLLKKAWFN